MIVHLHASCWNEAAMLPFFFRHYDRLVDRYIIHDNGSDDGSLEILAGHPKVTVLPLVLEGDSVCEAAFRQVNSFWKPSVGEADWTAVCNIDEFFWHPDLRGYLRACRRRAITFVPAKGFEMVSGAFPPGGADLAATVRRGVPEPSLDKPSFFDPLAITDSGFRMARHGAAPQGAVICPARTEVYLLHYKFLGAAYVARRHAELDARMRERDRQMGWGFHYDPEKTAARVDALRARARTVVPHPALRPLARLGCRLRPGPQPGAPR